MKLSIIIVTYKSNSIIKNCLLSIQDQSELLENNYEVIIVDNSPKEYQLELESVLSDIPLNNLKLIINKQNLGYGAGNNVGLRIAKGDVVCIMNPDIRLIEPIFEHAINSFLSDSQLGMIGYKQFGGANLSYYLRPEKNMSILTPVIVKLFNKINLFSNRYFYLSGALLFLDKNKFFNIDLFDENIFLYYEEPDISNRLIEKGYKIKYIAKKKYYHDVSVNDRSKWSKDLFDQLFISVLYYLEKYNYDLWRYILKVTIWYYLLIILEKIIIRKHYTAKLKFARLRFHAKNCLKGNSTIKNRILFKILSL